MSRALSIDDLFKDLQTLHREVSQYILRYDLAAPYLAVRAVAPIVKRHGQDRIANTPSIAAFITACSSIAYCVAKAGLVHLTRCTAVTLAPEVLVNCVAPGMVEDRRMTANLAPDVAELNRQSTLLKPSADKDDVADAVQTMVRGNGTTAQTLPVDLGKVYPRPDPSAGR